MKKLNLKSSSKDTQALTLSDPQAVTPSDAQVVTPSDPQATNPSDPQALTPSDAQALTPSDAQAVNSSDPQVESFSDSHVKHGGVPSFIKHELHISKNAHMLIYAIIAGALTLLAVLALIFLPPFLYDGGARGGIKREGTFTSIVTIYLLLMTTLAVLFFSGHIKREGARFFTTKNITRTAVFSSLAIVLYYFVKFPVPFFFPSFLDFQFSDLPALLAGFMMGPIGGAIVIIIKFLVKLPASGTMYVGELVDLILGLSFVITSSIIYRKKRTLRGAILSLVIGSLVCTFMAALANRFIAVPAYVALMFDGNWDYLLGAMNTIFNGKVTEDNFYLYYIFLSVVPFNLLRCLLTSVLTFITYKQLKRLFDRIKD